MEAGFDGNAVLVNSGFQLKRLAGRATSAGLKQGISDFQGNLAEVLPGFVVFEGRADFLQRETAIDDWLHAIGVYRPNHVFLICSAANGDSADSNLIGKQCRDRHFS
jgi:hypothetical protein